jgi:hypothetical protein
MLRWELRHRRTPRSGLRAGSIAIAPPRAPRPEAPPLEGSPSAILLGVLPPVAGAFFQETIDVAVILNALRAIGGGGLHTLDGDDVETRDFSLVSTNDASAMRDDGAAVPVTTGR